LSGAALAAAGATGADCERFVRSARRRAREAGRAMMLADLMTGPPGGRSGRPTTPGEAGRHVLPLRGARLMVLREMLL
jgi:hypothetical protein